MSGILPFRSEVEVTQESPRVIDLGDEESEAIFNALASDTSRAIYRALYNEAATASQIAEKVDTSVQNVRYHVEKLEQAGLIDQVDTWYSSRGNEMAVYAAMDQALIVSGDRHRSSELRSVITSMVSGLAILAAVSLALHWVIIEHLTTPVDHGEEPFNTLTAQPNSADVMIQAPQSEPATMSTVEVILGNIVSISPSILVFIGGLLVLLTVGAMHFRSFRNRYGH